MAELTERERKIVFIKFIMHGEKFSHFPVNTRENMLMAALNLRGLKYDKDEMLDLGQAILDEQEMFNKNALGFLEKNKDKVKAFLGEFDLNKL